MSGATKSGVVCHSSSIVSRARWAGALSCWKIKWRHVYVTNKINKQTTYLQRAFVPFSIHFTCKTCKIIKINQDFSKLWWQIYCHVLWFTACNRVKHGIASRASQAIVCLHYAELATHKQYNKSTTQAHTDNRKPTYRRDSAMQKRPFTVTQGHPLLCQSTRHIWLAITTQ